MSYPYTSNYPNQSYKNSIQQQAQQHIKVRNINPSNQYYEPQYDNQQINKNTISNRTSNITQVQQKPNTMTQRDPKYSNIQQGSQQNYDNSKYQYPQQYKVIPSHLPQYNTANNNPQIRNQQSTQQLTSQPRIGTQNQTVNQMTTSNNSYLQPNTQSYNPITNQSYQYSNGSSTASSNKNSLTTSNSSSYGNDKIGAYSKSQLDQNQINYPYANQYNTQNYSQSGTQMQQNYGQYNQNSTQSTRKVFHRKCGLQNIGNTCYMNSALQCVFNIPGFLDYFTSGKFKKEINQANKGIANEFAELALSIEENTTKNSYLRPSGLKFAISKVNQQFLGSGQQDSQEFLRTLLDGLHNDLNRVQGKKPYRELEANIKLKPLTKIGEEWFQYYLDRDNSIVTDYFTGQLMSKVTCQVCQSESIAFDNFMDLSLSFTAFRILISFELDRLIKAFLKEENLDDTYYCKNCKKHTKSKRQFYIWQLPEVLVIHLKRFHFGSTRREKINLDVTFPIQDLDMGQYLERQTNNQDFLYDLIGIVNHSGNLYGGHYTAQCRNPYDGTWNEFNDSQWNEINIKSQNYDTKGSHEPYLLFYCKKGLAQKYRNAK
ncbi:ubiquitin carboxy-terminal hydrolase (macronuclear) [Tetrahymena thermophila SB210]|uniref:Ubiquitin carboxyl-terminal hydrolase n=1 Tax=Tetrahymena thermophila (strain SB210) TaxID=312017 RepID=I7M9J6_TETTS|nr:ubiquitin carboxy-terminal hydrolase [Tetrahymena thermophila SB210]EAS01964.2 ubiquitin carboxy-terminal hydrolase [Tetrahymena thermophila SB210]|eukprot:XP_001022209.2 ubiquitin carboxy-terminal hydrolase [Tetrahymena thermophila SB210]